MPTSRVNSYTRPGRPLKWTPERQRMLYRELTARYGPYREWYSRNCPFEGELGDYVNFLDSIRFIVGADSIRAVQNQIDWAITGQTSTTNKGHARCLFMNKVMAFEEGFIDTDFMPTMAELEY